MDCVWLLFFKVPLESLKKCGTEIIDLPATDNSQNLGYGVWLIASATKAYMLYEKFSNISTATVLVKYPGCNICKISLACGTQLSGPHITIRWDLKTSQNLPAIKIHMHLPDRLKHLVKLDQCKICFTFLLSRPLEDQC